MNLKPGDTVYKLEKETIIKTKVKETSELKGILLEDETKYRQSFEEGIKFFKTRKEAKQMIKYHQKKG